MAFAHDVHAGQFRLRERDEVQVRMLFAQPTPCVTTDSSQPDQLCQWLYDQTNNRWLADGGYYLLLQPGRILLIVLLAIFVRWLINHAIDKVVKRTGEGKVPGFLRPLRDKIPGVT